LNITAIAEVVKRKMDTSAERGLAGFRQRLRQLIDATGLSDRAFALALDIHPNSMSRYVRGIEVPGADGLARIAARYPGQVEWLLTGREPTEVERWQALLQAVPAELRPAIEDCARLFARLDHDVALNVWQQFRHLGRLSGLLDNQWGPPVPQEASPSERQTPPTSAAE
jgi:transcriptional regulator with XRE-family HTH domain